MKIFPVLKIVQSNEHQNESFQKYLGLRDAHEIMNWFQ